MARKHIDAEDYHINMEVLDFGIMDHLLSETGRLDPSSFTGRDVRKVLDGDCGSVQFVALLSPAAESFIEEMATRTLDEIHRHFGNSILLFTPLYVSNYCSNECVYYGFNHRNRIKGHPRPRRRGEGAGHRSGYGTEGGGS